MNKNIVLLTIDALRADHTSFHGYERETTPLIKNIADDSTVFLNTHSASSHTREAVPALLTGQYPTEAVSEGFVRGNKTIPMLLPSEYETAGFHSNPYLSRAYNYDEGFDHFYDDLRLGRNKLTALAQRAVDKFILNRGEYHARAAKINKKSVSWLESVDNNKPFFLWNHYMDVHGPYNPPEGYTEWSDSFSNTTAQQMYDELTSGSTPSDETIRICEDLYDGEIKYIDKQIYEFISTLDEKGILNDSLVIISSDHGDLFGEHGHYAHPRYVFPELTHVPLIIKHPAISAEYVKRPTSTLDILPTILEYVGLSASGYPGKPLQNENSRSAQRRVYASATSEASDKDVRRFSIFGTDLGFRCTRDQNTGEISEEDSFPLFESETTDKQVINGSKSKTINQLREELIVHSSNHLGSNYDNSDEPQISKNVEDRLNALGYK